MRVYLLRHGIAEERAASGRDEDRNLTQEGIAVLQNVLLLARRADVRPSLILSSPYTRASQTAGIAARILEYSGEILQSSNLQPNLPPSGVWDELQNHRDEESVLVVAHEPLLPSTVAWFLGSTREMIRFAPATLVCVDFELIRAEPTGVLRWMIAPELG